MLWPKICSPWLQRALWSGCWDGKPFDYAARSFRPRQRDLYDFKASLTLLRCQTATTIFTRRLVITSRRRFAKPHSRPLLVVESVGIGVASFYSSSTLNQQSRKDRNVLYRANFCSAFPWMIVLFVADVTQSFVPLGYLEYKENVVVEIRQEGGIKVFSRSVSLSTIEWNTSRRDSTKEKITSQGSVSQGREKRYKPCRCIVTTSVHGAVLWSLSSSQVQAAK